NSFGHHENLENGKKSYFHGSELSALPAIETTCRPSVAFGPLGRCQDSRNSTTSAIELVLASFMDARMASLIASVFCPPSQSSCKTSRSTLTTWCRLLGLPVPSASISST